MKEIKEENIKKNKLEKSKKNKRESTLYVILFFFF